jgi:hypothetical protein
MLVTAGNTIVTEVTFSRKVNGVTENYDPTSVRCSFLHADGTEEVKIYSGTEPDDEDVIRTARGCYETPYIPRVKEELRIEWIASDTVGAKTWPSKSRSIPADIQLDSHTGSDVSAITP